MTNNDTITYTYTWTLEDQERQRKEHEAWYTAQVRATDLLESCLSPEQLESWITNKKFVVDGKYFRYQIVEGTVGNILVVKGDGTIIGTLCVMPNTYNLPPHDVVAAQKLALDAYEDHFLLIAHFSPAAYFGSTLTHCQCHWCRSQRGEPFLPPTTKVYEYHPLSGGL